MNAVAFTADAGGVAHISQLQQLERAEAVILNTLGPNGILRSETLSRLPSEMTHCVDISIVINEGGRGGESDSVSVVLDKARRRGPCTMDDVDDVALAAIIRRNKNSIPTFVATVPLGRTFEDVPGEVYHQGLIDPG